MGESGDGAARVKELFLEAVALDPEARDRYLDSLGDPQLKAELGQLLACDAAGKDLLDEPIAGLLWEQGRGQAELPVGALLKGRYRVDSVLSAGGFSTVYLGRDEQLRAKPVVVKVLTAGGLELEREIEALARTNHPSVVAVLDRGRLEDTTPYIVTEYVPGETLRQTMSAGPMAAERTARIINEVAQGLDAAHRQGVLHLDVKPENVILSRSGGVGERATIIDFGIARRSTASATESLAGSPAYMAPECRRGQMAPAADVYALGVMTCEMLTGRLPEPGAAVGRFLRQLRPDLPHEAVNAIARATAENPSERFAHVQDYVPALEQGLRAGGRGKRVWFSLALAAAFGGLLVVALRDRERPGVTPVAITSYPGVERQVNFSPDGQKIFYSSYHPSSQSADIFVQTVGQHRRLRLTTHPAQETFPVCSPTGDRVAFLRGVESQAAIVVLPSGGGQEEVVAAEGWLEALAWGPTDRILLASVRDPGAMRRRLVRIDREERSQTDLLPAGYIHQADADPALSPDGRTLVFVRRKGSDRADLHLLSMDGQTRAAGEPRRLTNMDIRMERPQWTPDGRDIVFAAGVLGSLRLYRVPADGSRLPQEIVEAGEPVEHPSIALRTPRLAFARPSFVANMARLDLDAPGGRVISIRPLAASSRNENRMKISPDGKAVAFISNRSGQSQVWITSLDGTEEMQRTFFKRVDGIRVFWIDRDWLAVGLRSAGLRTYLLSADGKALKEILSGGMAVGSSANGRFVYYLSNESGVPEVWRVPADGGEASRLVKGGRFVAESQDGRELYFSRGSEIREIWKMPVEGGAEVKVLEGVENPSSCAVSRSGIYYVSRQPRAIRLQRFDNGQKVELHRMDKPPAPGLEVSADERTILFSQYDQSNTDIMMIDPLRD
jgi:serine/threonine protein kinase